MADSPISYYEIIVREVNSDEIVTITTSTNITNFNVASLLTGISYELIVVAISEDGNITARSLESRSVVIIVTGMYLLCLYVLIWFLVIVYNHVSLVCMLSQPFQVKP